jgi:outer membrane protein insertion porin family
VANKRILTLLLFFVLNCNAQSQVFNVSLEDNQYCEQVKKNLVGDYLVERFECIDTLTISSDEMAYILGITLGEFFTADTLCKGLKRLQHKAKLASLKFEISPGDKGVLVKVTGQGFWTLRALRIIGISFGKQKYYPLYEIANGEQFSIAKHNSSVQAIERALKTEGYLNAKVRSYFMYYTQAKALDARVIINRGSLFKIDKAYIKIEGCNLLNPLQTEQLSLTLKHKFIDTLVKRTYTNELITRKMKTIKAFLEERGVASTHVEVDEKICYHDARVKVAFFINLDKSRSFEFFGNHYFSVAELSRVVTHFGKDAGMLPAQILAQEILTEYHKKGFWQAELSTTTEDQKDFFVIKEGPRIRVKALCLKGIETYKERWLVKHFLESLTNQPFDSEKEKEALDKLIVWYKQQGFWEAAVLQRKHRLLEKQLYELEVVIDEGEQRFVCDVTIDNYPDLEQSEHFLFIKQRGNKKVPFSASLLGKQQNYLVKKFRGMGFLYATVNYHLEKETDGFHIKWTIIPGQYVTFGKTIVRGYTKIPFSLLRKQLAYQTGDVWSKEKLQSSLSQLRSLNLFERISLRPLYTVDKDCVRDVLLTVQEDDPIEVKLRLGYQQVSKSFAFTKESSYKVGSSFIWKNPFKKADKIMMDLDVTRFERLVSTAYQVPFFFGYPFTTTIKGYANKYTQPVSFGSNKSLYEVTQEGFLVGINSRKKYIDTGCNMGFEWMETKNISLELAQAMRFKSELVDKKIPYFFIEPSIFIDLLNNKLNPTKGMFALATLKGMFPFEESSSYVKLLIEEGVFIPVGGLVIATRVRFGHIFRKTFTAIMPPERFYLGGSNSLRGYQTDKSPPLGSFVDEKGIRQWVAQGGKSMLNVNLELRFPLSSQPFYGVIFQDFGILEEEIHALLESKKPLASTGFGFRYITPIGPLRFDIGWKWNKQTTEDSSYAWFLTFGHAF